MNQSGRTTKPETSSGEQILQSAREQEGRLQRLWEMSVERRVQAMRRGELSLEQCAAWPRDTPSRSHS